MEQSNPQKTTYKNLIALFTSLKRDEIEIVVINRTDQMIENIKIIIKYLESQYEKAQTITEKQVTEFYSIIISWVEFAPIEKLRFNLSFLVQLIKKSIFLQANAAARENSIIITINIMMRLNQEFLEAKELIQKSIIFTPFIQELSLIQQKFSYQDIRDQMFNFLMRVEPINKIETINMVQSFMFAMSQVKDPEQFAWWYDIFMSSIGWILFPRGPLTAAGLIKSISPSQYFTGGCPLQLLAIIGHIFVKFISNIDYRPIIFKDIENLEFVMNVISQVMDLPPPIKKSSPTDFIIECLQILHSLIIDFILSDTTIQSQEKQIMFEFRLSEEQRKQFIYFAVRSIVKPLAIKDFKLSITQHNAINELMTSLIADQAERKKQSHEFSIIDHIFIIWMEAAQQFEIVRSKSSNSGNVINQSMIQQTQSQANAIQSSQLISQQTASLSNTTPFSSQPSSYQSSSTSITWNNDALTRDVFALGIRAIIATIVKYGSTNIILWTQFAQMMQNIATYPETLLAWRSEIIQLTAEITVYMAFPPDSIDNLIQMNNQQKGLLTSPSQRRLPPPPSFAPKPKQFIPKVNSSLNTSQTQLPIKQILENNISNTQTNQQQAKEKQGENNQISANEDLLQRIYQQRIFKWHQMLNIFFFHQNLESTRHLSDVTNTSDSQLHSLSLLNFMSPESHLIYIGTLEIIISQLYGALFSFNSSNTPSPFFLPPNSQTFSSLSMQTNMIIIPSSKYRASQNYLFPFTYINKPIPSQQLSSYIQNPQQIHIQQQKQLWQISALMNIHHERSIKFLMGVPIDAPTSIAFPAHPTPLQSQFSVNEDLFNQINYYINSQQSIIQSLSDSESSIIQQDGINQQDSASSENEQFYQPLVLFMNNFFSQQSYQTFNTPISNHQFISQGGVDVNQPKTPTISSSPSLQSSSFYPIRMSLPMLISKRIDPNTVISLLNKSLFDWSIYTNVAYSKSTRCVVSIALQLLTINHPIPLHLEYLYNLLNLIRLPFSFAFQKQRLDSVTEGESEERIRKLDKGNTMENDMQINWIKVIKFMIPRALLLFSCNLPYSLALVPYFTSYGQYFIRNIIPTFLQLSCMTSSSSGTQQSIPPGKGVNSISINASIQSQSQQSSNAAQIPSAMNPLLSKQSSYVETAHSTVALFVQLTLLRSYFNSNFILSGQKSPLANVRHEIMHFYFNLTPLIVEQMNIIATQKQNSLQQLSNVPVSSTAQQGIDSVADVDQIISSSYTLTLGSNFNLISSLALLILRGLTLLCIDALYCGMDKEALSGGITNILKLLNAALSCIDIHPMNQIQQESITPGKINTNQETAVNQIQPTSFASQSQYQSSRVQQLKKTCSKNEQKNEIFNVLTYDTLSLSNIDGMLVVVRSALEILIQLSSFGQLMTLANPNLPKIIIAKLAVNMKVLVTSLKNRISQSDLNFFTLLIVECMTHWALNCPNILSDENTSKEIFESIKSTISFPSTNTTDNTILTQKSKLFHFLSQQEVEHFYYNLFFEELNQTNLQSSPSSTLQISQTLQSDLQKSLNQYKSHFTDTRQMLHYDQNVSRMLSAKMVIQLLASEAKEYSNNSDNNIVDQRSKELSDQRNIKEKIQEQNSEALTKVSNINSLSNELETNLNSQFFPHTINFSLGKEGIITVIDLQNNDLINNLDQQNENSPNLKPSTRIIIRDCTGKHIWDFTPVYDKFRNAYMKDVKANEEDQIRIRQQLREKELKRLKEKQISLIETSDNNSLPLFRKTDDALGNITNVLLKQKGIDIKQPILGNIDDMIAMGKEIEQSTDIQHNKENEKINIENYLTQELPPQRESVYMSNTRSILANLGIINPNVANSLAQLRLMQYDASKMIESAEERRSVNLNEFQGQLQIGQFLDSLPVRTTVEISVFYAAPNQNTVEDILGNNFASASFCAFVRGLGWEIDLSTHRGYCGSIVEPCKPAEKQFNHHTRFYYSSPTIEVIFHVCPFLAQTDGLQTIEEKTSLLQVSQTCIIWWDNSFEYDPSMLRPLGFIHQIIIRPTSFESSSISTQNQAEQTLIDPLTSINSSASFNDQQTIATEPLSNSHLFHINIDENPSFSCQYNDTLKDLTQQNPQNNQDFATDKVSIQSSIPTPLHSSLPAKNEPASGWNECYNSPFYSRSPSIFIGPLCDNVLVPPHILPILVRGTALSANRCQNIARGKQPFFDALIIRMISISRIVESSQIPFSSSEYFSSFFY